MFKGGPTKAEWSTRHCRVTGEFKYGATVDPSGRTTATGTTLYNLHDVNDSEDIDEDEFEADIIDANGKSIDSYDDGERQEED